MTSGYDSYRPPQPSGRKRDDGAREARMVDAPEFSSYYGRPVVKAPPWGDEIAAYLFLGGLAGGSALLSAGGQLTGRHVLSRNARLTALGAVSAGTAALIHDLGRPERFLYMLRTFKLTSPMSVGTWLLSAFGAGAGITAANEIDRLAEARLPLGPLRQVLRRLEVPAEVQTALLAAPLSSYTAVLLSNTAVPTWNASRDELPYVFVCSASMAASGMALVTTPVREAQPARVLALCGAAGELLSTTRLKRSMHPAEAEPLESGVPGKMLKWAERLTVAGGAGAALAGGHRGLAAASGLLLLGGSALTRFGFLRAGIASAEDPRHAVLPQRDRLEARRAAGVTDDSITTAG